MEVEPQANSRSNRNIQDRSSQEKIYEKYSQLSPRFNVKDPLQFSTGQSISTAGNIIIKNKNNNNSNTRQQGEEWVAVCYYREGNKVYVCLQVPETSPHQFGKSQEHINYNWYQKWYGEEYDIQTGNLLYVGGFLHFQRDSQDAVEIIRQPGASVIVYVGAFKLGTRNAQSGREIWRDGKSDLMWRKGTWENGRKQGTFQKVTIKKMKITIQQYFHNDIQVSKEQSPATPISKPSLRAQYRYDEQLTEKLRNGFQPQKWLASGGVDYLFARLVQSYHYSSFYRKPVKAMSIDFFELLAPSRIVTKQDVTFAQDENVRKAFSLHHHHVSVFEVYPLILLPLNQDTSHFALAAIETKVKRENHILQQVQFSFYNLDPMGGRSTIIFNHLIRLVKSQIEQNVHPGEKHIYYQALLEAARKGDDSNNPALRNSSTLKATLQDNDYDCGVYTAIYGALLIYHIGAQRKVSWQFDRQAVRWLRETIYREFYCGDCPFIFVKLIKKLSETIYLPAQQ